ncbi:Aluminum-activated malate transporter [Musa troglodytarum]|uniref:Aluminum-activated malate transporter n=1 Tax=Musa troglodytarum TaxID=320322 RepID=A0A9E7HMZ8_9LILI|nr:Aluminum-activated malate transporter [Musa troglodytarum]
MLLQADRATTSPEFAMSTRVEMASEKEASRGLEWQVTVPGGSSVRLEADSAPAAAAGWRMHRLASAMRSKVFDFASKVRRIAAEDPRKVVHCMKVGLALALVSVFYYTRPLYDGVGGAAMWAVMTVVVVFEFTVGGSLCKGLNRATATLTAGSVAFGIHWLAIKSGRTADHIILGAAVFLLSSAATFSRFIPTINARFDYGVTIFILTFNLVAVSSYRVEKLLALAQWRFCTITIGFCICLTVCVVIRPVWAGEELHRLVMRNMEKLADSLEESVAEYLEEEGGVDGNQKLGQKSQGYKCVLNSKSSEDSMQPPDSVKKHLTRVYAKVTAESSKVLKELASSFRSMRKPSSIDYLVEDMKNTADELQNALGSLPQEATSLIVETLPLITAASLLIEVSVESKAWSTPSRRSPHSLVSSPPMARNSRPRTRLPPPRHRTCELAEHLFRLQPSSFCEALCFHAFRCLLS